MRKYMKEMFFNEDGEVFEEYEIVLAIIVLITAPFFLLHDEIVAGLYFIARQIGNCIKSFI